MISWDASQSSSESAATSKKESTYSRSNSSFDDDQIWNQEQSMNHEQQTPTDHELEMVVTGSNFNTSKRQNRGKILKKVTKLMHKNTKLKYSNDYANSDTDDEHNSVITKFINESSNNKPRKRNRNMHVITSGFSANKLGTHVKINELLSGHNKS